MSDPVSMARMARERLAQALGALQSPGVPPHLLDVAEPVAQAMSALHRIESSPGSLGSFAPQALDSVRRALSGLQAHAPTHPAAGQAVEFVAGSLNLVHQLATASGVATPSAQHAGFPPATVPAALEATQLAGQYQQPPARAPANAPQYAQPQQPVPAPQPAPPWQGQRAPVPQQPGRHGPAFGATAPSVQDAAPLQPPSGGAGAPPPAAGQLQRVDAELGAHSPTNFYKGLSGNDVIEAGGIFIATYQIPPMGSHLLIHVSMPGGYEFEAKGIVRWTREAPQSGSPGHASVPPGYGAQFTEISAEGRHLVYRYTRNREPLFHDDF